MKASGFILLLLVWQTSFSQFIDSFDDGDLTSNPPWSGNTVDFSVTTNRLQLLAPPVSGSSFLVTPSQSINSASWQFNLRMAFNPSSSNYIEVYLASDSPDLSDELAGYYLRIGWSTDNIALVRQDGLEREIILEGTLKRLDLNTVNLNIRVTRSNAGEWVVYSQLISEEDWFLEGSVLDTTHTSSAYFGVKCNYTSTRSDKFSLDDFMINGEPFVDRQPPTVDTLYTNTINELVVIMTEPVDPASVEVNNFLINNAVVNSAAVVNDSIKLVSAVDHKVDNKLSFVKVKDLAGNMIGELNYKFIHYSLEPIEFGDIVFNEVFPDPSPPVDLPEAEYLEIMNSSDKAIFMTNWSLSDRSTMITLPEIKLKPDSLVVLAQKNTDLILPDKTIVLDRWPSLNNAEDELWLRDSSGSLVDYLFYELSLYGDPLKEEGGWSLERLDPYLPCTGGSNWQASEHPVGGTPGYVNSVYTRIKDLKSPELVEAYAFSSDSVVLFFSEPLGALPENILIADIEILNIDFGRSFSQVILKTSPLFLGKVYDLSIPEVRDCSGNISHQLSKELVLPDHPLQGDLVINEILFNPAGDGQDYLEVFNQSSKYLPLQNMRISNGTSVKVVTHLAIIEPGGYRVFTPDPEVLLANYPKAGLETVISQDLPTFTNDTGTAVVQNATGIVLDSIIYDERWHFGYLNDVDGVALERLSPYRPGTASVNWASASSQHNYGTPGYRNSQNSNNHAQNNLSVEPKVIVPDADGRDDFTTISLHETDNALVTIRIYTLHGLEVAVLANNELLSGTSFFNWDGTDKQGRLVPLGHYIITADLIYDNGRTTTYREKMVVGTGY